MKRVLFYLLALLAVCSCSVEGNFTKEDIAIIRSNPEELLRLYTIETESDLEVLRKTSTYLSQREMWSDDYSTLAKRMILTVSDPSVDGVGIAAPQIGINKRIVVVQRYDKEGYPFKAYPNISILSYSEETMMGAEGCLSVPGERYDVCRSSSIVISYYDVESRSMVTETVSGFTAVIFQHEVDHLDGIIYTDRVLM
jgi:peptide deformylase